MFTVLGGFKTSREKRLGYGAYGEVLRGSDSLTGEHIAIKLERASKHAKRSYLEHEYHVYTALAGGIGIPCVRKYGLDGKNHVLVMDLLGPNLETLRRNHEQCLSLKTVLMLAEQIITRVEFIHSRHILHRDIKPDNIVIGAGSNADSVYIVDFGTARHYRDPTSGIHHPFLQGKGLVGTTRFTSFNTHLGYAPSRRDDLETIAYSLIYLAKGELPWQHVQGGTPKQKKERVKEKKRTWTPERLTEGLPEEFAVFLAHVCNLKYEEKPDYQYYRGLFRTALQKEGYHYDSVFDWTPGAPSFSRVKRSLDSSLSICRNPTPLIPQPKGDPPFARHLKGAYIFIKILARATLQHESHLVTGWSDHSFWQSSTLSRSEWQFSWRPAVVLRARSSGSFTALLILPIMHRQNGLQSLPPDRRQYFVPVQELSDEEVYGYSVRPIPSWPLGDTYHCINSRLKVHVDSDAAKKISVNWRLDEDQLEQLLLKVTAIRPKENQLVDVQDGGETVSVKRHRRGMSIYPIMADIAAMDLKSLENRQGAVWGSSHGWLRECNKLERRKLFEHGRDGGTATSELELPFVMRYSYPPPSTRSESCTIELKDQDRIVDIAGRVLCLASFSLPLYGWKALALSHPVFRHHAQRRIFCVIRLSSAAQAGLLLDAFATRSELARLVHTISIALPLRDASKAILMTASSTLRVLSLQLSAGEDAHHYIRCLTHAQSLQTLSITGPEEGTAYLTWRDIPTLQHLCLVRLSIYVPNQETPFSFTLASLKVDKIRLIIRPIEDRQAHLAMST